MQEEHFHWLRGIVQTVFLHLSEFLLNEPYLTSYPPTQTPTQAYKRSVIKTWFEQCSDLLWGPYGPVFLSVDAIVVTLTGSAKTGATVTGVIDIGVTTGATATGVTAGVPT